MITDMFGGYEKWLNIFNQFMDRLIKNDFGDSQLNRKKLLKIIGKRKNLYDRWYGKRSLADHLPQLLAQGAEYATVGSFIVKKYKNCLIFGADNDAMSPFYSIDRLIPTLYLKRFYC